MLIQNPRESVDLRHVRTVREARGMSRRELADKTGVSTQAICMLEAGKTGASLYTIIRFADALECTIDALLGREKKGVEA